MSSKIKAKQYKKKQQNVDKLMQALDNLRINPVVNKKILRKKSNDSKKIKSIFDKLMKKEEEQKNKLKLYNEYIKRCEKDVLKYEKEIKFADNVDVFINKMEKKIKEDMVMEMELRNAFMQLDEEDIIGAVKNLKMSQ